MKSICEAVKWGGEKLAENGFEDPSVEVEAILGGLLNVSPAQLHLNPKQELPLDVDNVFMDLVGRRCHREPVAYLLGRKNFYGRDFYVNRQVLIPRPETEILVERILTEIKNAGTIDRKILEIGTGSGCVAISLACESSSVAVVAVDISEEALTLARLNAERHGTEPKIQFIRSDLYGQLGPQFKGYFDIIVSNPPYISSSYLDKLDQDLHFEPRVALDGGSDGLFVYRPLIQHAQKFLKTKGFLALEIGFDQGASVSKMMKDAGFEEIEILKDLARHDRVVTGRLSGSI